MYTQLRAKNFEIIGIAKDGDDEVGKARWINALEKDRLTWVNILYKSPGQLVTLDQLYKVQSYPSNFLISPDGKIIAKNLRGEDLIKKIIATLK